MPSASVRQYERLGRYVWALIDSVAWAVAVVLSAWLRFDLDIHQAVRGPILALAAGAVVCQLVFGAIFGPYAVGHDRGSFEETYDVGRTVLITTLLLLVAVFAIQFGPIPRSVPFTAPAFAMLGMFSARFIIRSVRTAQAISHGDEDRRVVIFGAGSAGRRLTRSLIRDADSGYRPVALLDDDPSKARLRIEGIEVRGTRADLARVVERQGADTLIIALPLAHATTIRALTELAEDLGLKVLTLPPLRDIIDGRPTAEDLRKVDVADLLGRHPVELDMAVIAEQIAGKRILVTGAGGSIGSELCRQIARFGPERLFLLDRDESGLQETQMSLVGNGLLDSDDLILANIRDIQAMRMAFDRARPDIVFHAAALLTQQLQPNPPRPPPRMLAPHLSNHHLHRLSHLLRTQQRPMRPIHRTTQLLRQIQTHPPMHRRPVHPKLGRDLSHLSTSQHSPNRVQALLHHRQDNQCQSGLPESGRPTKTPQTQGADHGPWRTSPDGRLSHITRRSTHVALDVVQEMGLPDPAQVRNC